MNDDQFKIKYLNIAFWLILVHVINKTQGCESQNSNFLIGKTGWRLACDKYFLQFQGI